jgi:acetyltransferase-like isoleucine patch superfamily enzyme
VSAATASRRTVLRRATKIARRLLDLYLWFASNAPSHSLRIAALRITGAQIGSNVALGRGVRVFDPWRLQVGANTIIGMRVILDGRGGLVIGDNCNISDEVAIWTAEHDIQSPDFAMTVGGVTIGNRVWLCFRSTILPGIAIGEGAVVASGSVVSRHVPPSCLVGGVPAKQIAMRSTNLTYQLGRRAGP